MGREETFAVESFTGVMLENLQIVPSEDGRHLGVVIQPPLGDPVRIVIPEELMDAFAEAVTRGTRECQRLRDPERNDNTPHFE
jgi:hypothetical protein